MAKKTADVTLSEAQTELVNINARLSDASARRDKLLQFFGDDKSLDAVEAEITVLRRQHERQAARVKLFEQQVEQAQAAAALARRQEHVERFTQKLLAADQVADQLQATIEKADTLFRKVIQLREDARVSWWGTSAHENALSVSPDGAALSGIAVKALLMHELYRVGARPFVGGSPGELKAVDWPGAQCPRHEWLGTPDKIEPLGARMRRASKAAINIMKAKIPDGEVPSASTPPSTSSPDTPSASTSPSAPPPSGNSAPPSTSSPPQASGNGGPPSGNGGGPKSQPATLAKLSDQLTLPELLKQQQILSDDFSPDGERKYAEIVKRIAELSP